MIKYIIKQYNMVKIKSNKIELITLTSQMDILKEKMNKLQSKIDSVKADTIDIECCGVKWESKKSLEKHKLTKKCMGNKGDKFIQCKSCHNKFFDGISNLSELMTSDKWATSSYKNHVDNGCNMSCPNPDCDIIFNSQYMLKKHNCGYRCPVIPTKPKEIIKEIVVKPKEKIIKENKKPCYTSKQKYHEYFEYGKKYLVNPETDKVYRNNKLVGNIIDGIIKYNIVSDETDDEYDDIESSGNDTDIEIDLNIINECDYGYNDVDSPFIDVKYMGLTHHLKKKTNKLYDPTMECIGSIINNRVVLLDELKKKPMTITSTSSGKITNLNWKTI